MDQDFGYTATYQFFRTERWLGRLMDLYSGEFQERNGGDEPFDYILTFFLNCHHIKDWLQRCDKGWMEDVDKKIKQRAIEQFITESQALRICADICNASKHFVLENNRSDSVPSSLVRHVSISFPSGKQTTKWRFTLNTSSGATDALDLAKECLELWRGFIRDATPEILAALEGRNTRRR